MTQNRNRARKQLRHLLMWPLTFAPIVLTVPARAQQGAGAQQAVVDARVSKVQRTVEARVGTGAFRKTREGAALRVGDTLRTGRRSKADVRFADGSLLRLGQLSTVELRSSKGVRLTGGQLLFSMLKPGRVLAGTAAAEIKGSVGLITRLKNGDAEFSLFSGRMDVVTATETIPIPPGSYVTVFAKGTRSKVRTAPPLRFAFGAYLPPLSEAPRDRPFTGSRDDLRSRLHSDRLALEGYALSQTSDAPYPIAGGNLQTRRENASRSAAVAGLASLGALALSHQDDAQASNASGSGDSESSTSDAEFHLEEVDPDLGRALDGDATAAYVQSNGASHLLTGRLRGFAARGPYFLDVAYAPTSVRRLTGGAATDRFAVFSDASLTVRSRRGDLQIGRQRFLSGPMRATRYGSLVRVGGRQVMDAITFRPRLRSGANIEIAYINDAFVDNLPYKIGGAQRGFYGRAAIETRGGNFGLNVLRYANVPTRGSTGITLDFALPLVRDKVELYGEVGRDTFRRGLLGAGIALPILYDLAQIELNLEYSRVQRIGGQLTPPDEIALLAYRRLSQNILLAGALRHDSNGLTRAELGLAFSAQTYMTSDY